MPKALPVVLDEAKAWHAWERVMSAWYSFDAFKRALEKARAGEFHTRTPQDGAPLRLTKDSEP